MVEIRKESQTMKELVLRMCAFVLSVFVGLGPFFLVSWICSLLLTELTKRQLVSLDAKIGATIAVCLGFVVGFVPTVWWLGKFLLRKIVKRCE